MTASVSTHVLLICLTPLAFSLPQTTHAQEWSIEVVPYIQVNARDDVIIPCKVVRHPVPKDNAIIKGFWKALGRGKLPIQSFDKNMFIYHPDNSLVLESFKNRTSLLGDIRKNNCSLLIKNVQQNDSGQYYFRIKVGHMMYSFKNTKIVNINVLGSPLNPEDVQVSGASLNPGGTDGTDFLMSTFPTEINEPSGNPLISILIPVTIGILLAVIVMSVSFLKCRKRNGSLAEADSIHYVNVQRVEGTLHCSKHSTACKEKIHDLSLSEEPIYINVQEKPPLEPVDNIYGNLNNGNP